MKRKTMRQKARELWPLNDVDILNSGVMFIVIMHFVGFVKEMHIPKNSNVYFL